MTELHSPTKPLAPTGDHGTAGSYRPDIDGLRAVSILGVVLCHAGLSFPGGYVGVDVFFVISGFVIAGMIRRQVAEGTFSLAGFWERRLRRIAPALLAMCAATAVAAWFILLPERHADFGTSLLQVVGMVSNLQFDRHTGYFSPAADKMPLLHTWSLAVEEQFYLAVPLLVLLVGLGKPGRGRRSLPITIGALFAASFVVSVLETRVHPNSAFYLIPSRAWELLVGVLLAMAPAIAAGARAWWREAAALAGIGLIGTAFFCFSDTTRFPGESALLPVIGAALIIWSGGAEGRATAISRGLATRPFVAIGLISYSLYLWHWPLLALTRAATPIDLALPTRAGLAVAAVPLAWLSYRYLEQPIRHRRLLPRGIAFGSAVAALAALVAAWGALLTWRQGFPDRLPESAQRFAADTAIDPRWTRNTKPRDLPERAMQIGEPSDPATVAIWGDSHAMAILPAIEALCAERHQRAFVFAHSSTAPLLDFMPDAKHGLGDQAPAFNRAVLDCIATNRVRAVLLAAYWGEYWRDPDFRARVEATTKALAERGVRVFFLQDVPRFPEDVPSALALCAWRGYTPELGKPIAEYRRDNEYLAPLAPAFAAHGACVLDPSPFLPTTQGMIRPFDASGSWYRDSHHLSARGALGLKPLLGTLFDP